MGGIASSARRAKSWVLLRVVVVVMAQLSVVTAKLVLCGSIRLHSKWGVEASVRRMRVGADGRSLFFWGKLSRGRATLQRIDELSKSKAELFDARGPTRPVSAAVGSFE